ncbi:ASCH domain-containing protein [Thiomicrorhabdus hydrogeniphila]
MRGLVIRQPWIELILSGKKTWEMRSGSINIRERIALIEQGTGLIGGEADLTDCIKGMSHNILCSRTSKHFIEDETLLRKWNVAWVLENVKRYDKPIPYQHPKGAVIWVKNLNIANKE